MLTKWGMQKLSEGESWDKQQQKKPLQNSSASIWRKSGYLMQREPATRLSHDLKNEVWCGLTGGDFVIEASPLHSPVGKPNTEKIPSKSMAGVGWARHGSLHKSQGHTLSCWGAEWLIQQLPTQKMTLHVLLVPKSLNPTINTLGEPGKERTLLVTARREALQISRPGFVTLTLLPYYFYNSVISPSLSFLRYTSKMGADNIFIPCL